MSSRQSGDDQRRRRTQGNTAEKCILKNQTKSTKIVAKNKNSSGKNKTVVDREGG